MRATYNRIVFLDSSIGKDYLDGLKDGIVFNGGNLHESYSGPNLTIKINLPVDNKMGRIHLKRGTSALYIDIQREDDSPVVKLRYSRKAREKSEIYRAVCESIEDMVNAIWKRN